MPKQPQPFTRVTDNFYLWSPSYLWSLWGHVGQAHSWIALR